MTPLDIVLIVLAWCVPIVGPCVAVALKLSEKGKNAVGPEFWIALALGVCLHFPGCVYASIVVWQNRTPVDPPAVK